MSTLTGSSGNFMTTIWKAQTTQLPPKTTDFSTIALSNPTTTIEFSTTLDNQTTQPLQTTSEMGATTIITPPPKPQNLTIITRKEWGSTVDKSKLDPLKLPVSCIIIHHTEGPECHTTKDCKKRVKNIQHDHTTTVDKVKGQPWDDIGYNYLIGGDGKVYEGRGCDKQGAHAKGHNDKSIGIAFIGNFQNKLPNPAALVAARRLIEHLLANGKVSEPYEIKGHRDVRKTDCPGDALYRLLKNSPKPKKPKQ